MMLNSITNKKLKYNPSHPSSLQLDNPDCGNLTPRFFSTHEAVARSKNYINMREVCEHHKLPPGHYVIIPTTFQPNEEAEFILRVLTEKADPMQ